MEASWVSAIASLASSIIVGITIIAAFVQIRHVRNSNEITVYLRMVERFDAFGAAGVFDRARPFASRVARESQLRLELTRSTMAADAQEISGLVLFVEHLSTLVVTDGISERLVLAEYAENLVEVWANLADFVYLRRLGRGPYYGVAFEDVAMRARRYLEKRKLDRLYGTLRKDPHMKSFQALIHDE